MRLTSYSGRAAGSGRLPRAWNEEPTHRVPRVAPSIGRLGILAMVWPTTGVDLPERQLRRATIPARYNGWSAAMILTGNSLDGRDCPASTQLEFRGDALT